MINLSQDEQIIFEVRRHWFVLALELMAPALFALIPFAAAGFLSAYHIPWTNKLIALFVFGSCSWLLLLWVASFIAWTNYFLDVWVITNKRVIAIEQHTLFDRRISEFRLERVQDVTAEIPGFLPTLLHFGNLEVQTAGEGRNFIIKNIPYPEKVKEVIFREHHKAVTNLSKQVPGTL